MKLGDFLFILFIALWSIFSCYYVLHIESLYPIVNEIERNFSLLWIYSKPYLIEISNIMKYLAIKIVEFPYIEFFALVAV